MQVSIVRDAHATVGGSKHQSEEWVRIHNIANHARLETSDFDITPWREINDVQIILSSAKMKMFCEEGGGGEKKKKKNTEVQG